MIMSESIIKFTRGVPPPESFPTQELIECSSNVLTKHSSVVLQYGPSGGFPPLRNLIANQCDVEDNRVILGQGSLQLVDFLARIILNPGDLAYVENPSYDRTVTLLRRAGANIIGFTLGQNGYDIHEVESRLKKGDRPKIFYSIPDFQNPSGVVIPLETRQRLVELAQAYGFWIMEDTPYRRLRYTGQEIPTMFDLAPDRVIRMSSYSKLISPGLRVGYVVAPPAVAGRLLKYAEDTYINCSYFNQAIVYDYIERGWLEKNISRLKNLYEPRLNTILKCLNQEMAQFGVWHKPKGGFFVGLMLNQEVKADELLAGAHKEGLVLSDGRGFFVNGGGDQFVRLPFCALTPDEIQEGINRLAKVVRSLHTN
jgi:2-aminoadipate transaminase